MCSAAPCAAAWRIGSAGADGRDAVIGLDHVALSAEQKVCSCRRPAARLPDGAGTVGAPVLGQFHGRAAEIAVILLQLGFEAGEERKGVGRRAGETGENLVLVEAGGSSWR